MNDEGADRRDHEGRRAWPPYPILPPDVAIVGGAAWWAYLGRDEGESMAESRKREEIAEIVQALRKMFKAIHEYSRVALKEFGVTGPQLWSLRTMDEAGAIPIGDLAERMYLHPSTVTGIVDRLEARGYAERVPSATDQRSVLVRLTAAGKRLLERAPHPAQGRLLHGLEGLTAKELSSTHAAVMTLVKVMEAQDVEATFFFDEEEES